MRTLLAHYLFCMLMAGGAAQLQAQGPVALDEAAARQNLIDHPDPTYPPIAKAAQVMGDVILQIEVDVNGRVFQTKVLSGPPMLRAAALDAVKSWTFKPFEKDEHVIPIVTKLVIPFHLEHSLDPNDQKIAAEYFPLFDKCKELLNKPSDPGKGVEACRASSLQADKFGSNDRFIERRAAYVYYTTSLIRNKDFKEAATSGTKAVKVVQQGHDDGSGSSAAYGVRGQARAFSGDLKGASEDLEQAEIFEHTALNGPAGHALNAEYTRTLKGLLMFHAQVLNALGDATAASAKQEEAKKL